MLLALRTRPSAWEKQVQTDEGLRAALLRFIADFANWDNAANDDYLQTGRALVRAAHPEQTPLVVDPFAGGGSIPLEALRLGCEAFASDLNPVACLILKVMLEDIPRHGPGLADELRRVGAEIKEQAANGSWPTSTPQDPDGATPIAYLWARTVRCEAPNCGAEIPLACARCGCARKTSASGRCVPGLCGRIAGRRASSSRYSRRSPIVRWPTAPWLAPRRPVSAAAPCCRRSGCVPSLPPRRGGADAVFNVAGQRTGGARLTAVVTLKPSEKGRHYRLPTKADYAAVRKAQQRVRCILG